METIKIKKVSNRNINKVFECELHLEGTEKQVSYAVSIINEKIDKTDCICQNLIRSGKMTDDEYYAGMSRLLKEFEALTDAKYVIEHVR